MKAASARRGSRVLAALALLISVSCSGSTGCPTVVEPVRAPKASAVVNFDDRALQVVVDLGRDSLPGLRIPDLPFIDPPAGVIVQVIGADGNIDGVTVSCVRLSGSQRTIDLVPREESRSKPPRPVLRASASTRMPWKTGDSIDVQIWMRVAARDYTVLTQQIMSGP